MTEVFTSLPDWLVLVLLGMISLLLVAAAARDVAGLAVKFKAGIKDFRVAFRATVWKRRISTRRLRAGGVI